MLTITSGVFQIKQVSAKAALHSALFFFQARILSTTFFGRRILPHKGFATFALCAPCGRCLALDECEWMSASGNAKLWNVFANNSDWKYVRKNCIFAFSHGHGTTCSYCLHLCSMFFWLGFTLAGHEMSNKRQLYKINIVTYAPDRWKLHNPNSCYRHNKDLSNTKKLGNRENREPNAGELEKQKHDNFKTNLYAQIARQRTTRNTIQVKAATWSGQGLHYIYFIWEVNMHLKKGSLSNKTLGPGYLESSTAIQYPSWR